MSFRLEVKKNSEGELYVETTSPEMCPEYIVISGHVDGQQVVDLTARVDNFSVSGSRRTSPAY